MPNFGSRPVSVDALRVSPVMQREAAVAADVVATPQSSPKKLRAWVERLESLTWPRGYQLGVVRLRGGVGGSTVAAAVASVLAAKNARSAERTLLFDAAGTRFTGPARRWGVPVGAMSVSGAISVGLTWTAHDDVWSGLSRTAGGAHVLLGAAGDEPPLDAEKSATLLDDVRGAFADVVVDLPVGLPVDLPWVQGRGLTDLVFVTAPDRASVSATAEALVWLGNQGVPRDRLAVIVNHGVPGRRDRAGIVELASRCACVGELPPAKAVSAPAGPAESLPGDVRIAITKVLLAGGREASSRALGAARTQASTGSGSPWTDTETPTGGVNPWIPTAERAAATSSTTPTLRKG